MEIFLSLGKDVVGLLGSIITIIPFFLERRIRRDLMQAESGGIDGRDAAEAYAAIAAKVKARLLFPRSEDLWLVMLGLLLIALSFVMSIVLTCLTTSL
jgi:hypothetical protein